MNNANQGKTYYCLEPSRFRLDGGAMFGIIPKPLWSKVAPPDEDNRIDLALRLLLIQSEDKNILIDTGIGDYHDEKFKHMFDVRTNDSPLKNCLKKINLNPDDITDLVLSHLHFDHIGGIGQKDPNSNELSPVFKNARCHIHRKHYEYALNPTARDAGSFRRNDFLPIIKYYEESNQLNWIESEQGEGELFPELEIRYRVSFGHTPWMIHPFDDNYIYLADLIPTSNHIHIPWVMGYDIAAGVTTEFKEEFLNFMEKKQLIGVYEHDPKFWGGKIQKNEKGKFIAAEHFEIPAPKSGTIGQEQAYRL